MGIAIVDYGSGNLRSAEKAFARALAEAGRAGTVTVTSDPGTVASADRIVLPGVGAFGDCRAGLFGLDGMVEALEEAVRRRARPFLGICVGMQLMADRGLEHGVHEGLGWIRGDVGPLAPRDRALKVPHMGWNALEPAVAHPLLEGIGPGAHFYFVHSYTLMPRDGRDLLAEADHGGRFAAMVGRDNLLGVQFHPEKSQANGLRLISNFLNWGP